MTRILLIGIKLDDGDMVARAAACGLDICLAQKPELYQPSQGHGASEVILADYSSPDFPSLVDALHAWKPFSSVLSLTEAGLVLAADLSERLGLPGNPAGIVRMLKDKGAMRAHLQAFPDLAVRALAVSTIHDLQGAVATIGYPCIVKPTEGAGSIGVVRLSDDADLDAYRRTLDEKPADGLIVEEFLLGQEYSVESLSSKGRHHVVAIVEKTIDTDFVEIGHTVPAIIDDQASAAIRTYVTRFLDSIGLVEGPTHTEIILTQSGPRIVESHNRIGGGKINDLVRYVYGVDMLDLTFRNLAEDLNLDRVNGDAVGAASIAFFTVQPGRVTHVSGAEAMAGHPAVEDFELRVHPGMVVRRVAGNPCRIGHVLVRAEGADDARALARRLLDMVDIGIEPASDGDRGDPSRC